MLGEEIEVDYFQSDVFALGVTLLQLMTLRLPLGVAQAWRSAESLELAVNNEINGLNYSPELRKLLWKMLSFDPKNRVKIEEIRLFTLQRYMQAYTPSPQFEQELEEAKHSEYALLQLAIQQLSQWKRTEAETVLLTLVNHYDLLRLKGPFLTGASFLFMHLNDLGGRYAESRKFMGKIELNGLAITDRLTIEILLTAQLYWTGRVSQANDAHQRLVILSQELKYDPQIEYLEYFVASIPDVFTIDQTKGVIGGMIVFLRKFMKVLAKLELFMTGFTAEMLALADTFLGFIDGHDVNQADSDPSQHENSQIATLINLFRCLSLPNPEKSSALLVALDKYSKSFGEWDSLDGMKYLQPEFCFKNPEEQLELASKLCKSLQPALDSTDQIACFSYIFQGNMHLNQSKLKNARKLFKLALTTAVKTFGKVSLEGALCYALLANVNRLQGKVDKADLLIEDSIDLFNSCFHPQIAENFLFLEKMGEIYLSERKLEEAKRICLAVIGTKVNFDGNLPEKQQICRKILSEVYFLLNETAECELILQEVVKNSALIAEEHNSDIATAYANLGSAYIRLEQPGKAVEMYEISNALVQDRYGEGHPEAIASARRLNSVHQWAFDSNWLIV
jgi:hypothetical protein